VPEVGNAVLVTIIETSALIGPNRVLWDTLSTSSTKVALSFRSPQGLRAA
jgi:hypothetical protein